MATGDKLVKLDVLKAAYDKLAEGMDTDTSKIKDGLETDRLLSIKTFDLHNGNLAQNGKWNNVGDAFRHIIVPIASGDAVEMRASTSVVRYGVLTSYITPVNDASTPYSVGMTGVRELYQRAYVSFNAPSDAAYLCVMVKYGTAGDTYPASLKINGREIAKSIQDTVSESVGVAGEMIKASDVVPFGAIEEYIGYPRIAGTWGEFGGGYKLKVLAVKPNATFEITANGTSGFYYGVLKAFDGVYGGGTIQYSEATGWTALQQVTTAGGTASGALPADAAYLMIVTLYNNTNTAPVSIVIDGIDYVKTVYDNLNDLAVKVGINMTMNDYPKYTANFGANGTWNQTDNNKYKVCFIPCGPKKPYILKVGGNSQARWAFLTNATAPVSGTTIPYCDNTGNNRWNYGSDDNSFEITGVGREVIGITPSDCACLALMVSYNSTAFVYDALWIDGYDYINGKSDNYNNSTDSFDVKWCAMGDSITAGYVSYINQSTGQGDYEVNKNRCWATRVAFENGWNIDNCGIGGTGWMCKGSGSGTSEGVSQSAYTRAANIAAETGGFGRYNLVTLAYGINDFKWPKAKTTRYPLFTWLPGTTTDKESVDECIDNNIKAATPTTPTTVIEAMKKTLDTILASNPLIKIIVITPLNCKGYSNELGTADTQWALHSTWNTDVKIDNNTSYEFGLDLFADVMKRVCDYYGVQCIDQTRQSCINFKNVDSALLDGVHPCEEAHRLLALELSKKITF